MKLRTQLIIGYGFIIILTVILGITALVLMDKINYQSTIIADNWFPSAFNTADMNTATSDLRIAELQHIMSRTAQEMEGYEKNMEAVLKDIKARQNLYVPLINSEQEQNMYNEFLGKWGKYVEEHEEVLRLSKANRNEEAKDRIREQSQQAFDGFSSKLLELVTLNYEGAQSASADGDVLYARSRWIVITGMLIVLIMSLVIAILQTYLIMRQVGGEPKMIATLANNIANGEMDIHAGGRKKKVTGILLAMHTMTEQIQRILQEVEQLNHAIQEGQLDFRGHADAFRGSWAALVKGMNNVINTFMQPFKGTGDRINEMTKGDIEHLITEQYNGDFNEIKNNLNRLAEKLQEIIGEIRAGTGVLSNEVQNLTVSSQEVASTSNQQAASVKEIVSTMEDSDHLAKSIATKVGDVTSMTESTKNTVNDGLLMIERSLEKMDEIKTSNESTITEIKTLSEKINSIWEIVNMINNIADQTKIIAFNAELEAASAGDAGKNFQIVASEIRRLADSTVTSTSEIKSQINEIQQSSDHLILSSESGTEKIFEGWELSQNVQKLFEQILHSAEVTDQAAEQIARSISQQVSAFEQILLTLKQISEGVDSFVVSTKATSGSAEKLQGIADNLQNAVESFVGNQ